MTDRTTAAGSAGCSAPLGSIGKYCSVANGICRYSATLAGMAGKPGPLSSRSAPSASATTVLLISAQDWARGLGLPAIGRSFADLPKLAGKVLGPEALLLITAVGNCGKPRLDEAHPGWVGLPDMTSCPRATNSRPTAVRLDIATSSMAGEGKLHRRRGLSGRGGLTPMSPKWAWSPAHLRATGWWSPRLREHLNWCTH